MFDRLKQVGIAWNLFYESLIILTVNYSSATLHQLIAYVGRGSSENLRKCLIIPINIFLFLFTKSVVKTSLEVSSNKTVLPLISVVLLLEVITVSERVQELV